MVGNGSSFGHNIPVGGGGREGWGHEDNGVKPNAIKKLSLGAESYVTIVTWKGFFTQSQVLVTLSMKC